MLYLDHNKLDAFERAFSIRIPGWAFEHGLTQPTDEICLTVKEFKLSCRFHLVWWFHVTEVIGAITPPYQCSYMLHVFHFAFCKEH